MSLVFSPITVAEELLKLLAEQQLTPSRLSPDYSSPKGPAQKKMLDLLGPFLRDLTGHALPSSMELAHSELPRLSELGFSDVPAAPPGQLAVNLNAPSVIFPEPLSSATRCHYDGHAGLRVPNELGLVLGTNPWYVQIALGPYTLYLQETAQAPVGPANLVSAVSRARQRRVTHQGQASICLPAVQLLSRVNISALQGLRVGELHIARAVHEVFFGLSAPASPSDKSAGREPNTADVVLRGTLLGWIMDLDSHYAVRHANRRHMDEPLAFISLTPEDYPPA